MSLRNTTLLGVALCALTSAAAAQSTQPAKAEQATAPRTPAVHPVGVARASDLIGRKVVDGADKPFGEVKDLIVCSTGDVTALIQRTADKQFIAMPLSALSPRLDSKADVDAAATAKLDRFVIVADTKIAAAPIVQDRNKLDAAWWKAYDEAYGIKPMAETAHVPMCIEVLIGQDVKTTGGESIGDVKDIAVDLADSRIAYVLISMGGTLGMGTTLHCVAFGTLAPNAERKFCTLPTDKTTLERTANVDIDKLPTHPNLEVGAATPASPERDGQGRPTAH
jgi:sporulation protein YlmC with PRC-barrel domain